MQTPEERPAESAGELYLKTDVSPEQIFQAIGRLRRQARDEVDRLLQFLDKTDDYVSRELEDDSCENEEGGDIEPSLGSLDRAANQGRWSRGAHSWGAGDVDRELDQSDDEPSLGAIERHPHCLGWPDGSTPTGDQTHWAAGVRRDLEQDPAESGIGDREGLLEQAGTEDCWQGGLA